MAKRKTPITDKNGKNTTVWKNDEAATADNAKRAGRVSPVVSAPVDTEMDDQLRSFLDDEYNNYRTAIRQGDAYVDEDGDEEPFTWQLAKDSLDQMPDDILGSIIGGNDVDEFRVKFSAMLEENGADSEIDF